MAWYLRLGFSENPLDVRPNPDLVGLEREENKLRNHIQKGEICFLNGLTGAGKSSMLKRLQEEMKEHKFVYLDAQDLPEDFNLEQELCDRRSFFDKIVFRKYPSKTPVLIIDEFQDTDQNIVLQARAKWENKDNQRVKAIIIAQIEKHLKNVTPSFKERLENRMITLPTLTDDEMREILQRRLETVQENYYDRLHSEAVNLLIAVADGNPRRLLEYTDVIFDFHHRKFGKVNPIEESPSYLITYYGAKEILQSHDVNVDAYKYLEPKAKKRTAKKFEKKFNKKERDLIMYMLTSPRTTEDIAEKLNVSKKEAYKRMTALKKKKAIESAGKKGNQQRWKATEHVKRLTVKV